MQHGAVPPMQTAAGGKEGDRMEFLGLPYAGIIRIRSRGRDRQSPLSQVLRLPQQIVYPLANTPQQECQ